jgi:hypothetical protein
MLHMLQWLYTYVCKVLFPMFYLFFQTYVASVLIWMLHMFHTYVASVLFGCCVCFTKFSSVFFKCFCKCFICMFLVFHLSSHVCYKCCIVDQCCISLLPSAALVSVSLPPLGAGYASEPEVQAGTAPSPSSR